jgi:hypothetical protein
MPLAGKVGSVSVLLKEFGNGRRLFPQAVFIARRDHD